MTRARSLIALSLAAGVTLAAPAAEAFCGFYVGGAGATLYNRATQVVLMREGVRTVLSMANDYEGPPEGFALVIPVPVVLQKENVKTLSAELFERVDQLDAPRLVEYWERDPCHADDGYGYEFTDDPLLAGGFGPNDATIRVRPGPVSVQVLNRFAVGEYQILILGAQDSLGLDTWLRDNGYRIPDGAEPILRPYVQSGMKFFVAKVDPTKLTFKKGRATLSPLRFHYDTDTFSLPIRLGLLSSPGTQDLIVHVLARGQRYEAANYENLSIPTNLDVRSVAKDTFGVFYATLFDHTQARRPRTMVTEYAWDAASCDPCPTPPLDPGDLAALGGEVFPPGASPMNGSNGSSFVLTRLHARYGKDAGGADVVFRAAPPISGGREVRGGDGALDHGARSDGVNTFQARYAIRHPWAGPITCASPKRGVWGDNPGTGPTPPLPGRDLAFAERGTMDLDAFLGQPLPEESFTAMPRFVLPAPTPEVPYRGGCAGCRVGADEGPSALAAASVLGLIATLLGRRRRGRPPEG